MNTKEDAIIGVAIAIFENEFYDGCPAKDRDEARRWFSAGFLKSTLMQGSGDLMEKIDKLYAELKVAGLPDKQKSVSREFTLPKRDDKLLRDI